MHMLLTKACHGALSLAHCMQHWDDLARRLREPPRRKRQYQCDVQIA